MGATSATSAMGPPAPATAGFGEVSPELASVGVRAEAGAVQECVGRWTGERQGRAIR